MASVLLRLDDEERETLKILTAALKVSEYTDDVDNVRAYQRADKMYKSMMEFFHTLIGLGEVGRRIAPEAQKQLQKTNGRDPAHFAPLVGPWFELGRRFKRLNPDKIRSEYGKLLMLLQDVRSSRIDKLGGIREQLVLPPRTVGSALNSIGATRLLEADELPIATAYLTAEQMREGVSAEKEKARSTLVERFGGGDDGKKVLVERCIRSIEDSKMFVQGNIAIINQLKKWLREYFTKEVKPYSLAISSRRNGSCLTHGHSEQQQYVLESLTLWGIIHRDIFDFWETVEEDMIGSGGGSYRFCDTGQGFHRVCQGPKTFSRMSRALNEAKAEMGGRWVGISVVHMGDQDVPNALVFIDKYTVIPKLLGPIVHTITEIDNVFHDEKNTYPGLKNLLKAKYGSGEELKMTILCDFFKHGFDGSGSDGGSCIDGRLTSAWNWTSLLHKKPYYDAFVLTGFTGFDAAYN